MPILFVLFVYDALLQSYYCFKNSELMTNRCFFRVLIPAGLMSVAPYFVMIMIWTIVWDYNPPLPMAEIFQLMGVFGFVPALGMEIYARNKKEGDVKRILWFVLQFAYLGPFFFATYFGIENLTVSLPTNLQWIIALVLPGMREMHILIIHKILLKAKPCTPEVLLFGVSIKKYANIYRQKQQYDSW